MHDLLPDGVYMFRLADAYHHDSVNAKWLIKCRFEAVDEPFASAVIYHSVLVTRNKLLLARRFEELAVALGTTCDDLVRRPDRFIGTHVLALVRTRVIEDRQFNEMSRLTAATTEAGM